MRAASARALSMPPPTMPGALRKNSSRASAASMLDGSSVTESAAAGKLTQTETPEITADGKSRSDPNYKLPPELVPVLKSGFELAENDEPVIDTLLNDAGYVMVAPARIIAAAPAPLESIRDRVAQDWVNNQASQRAK